MATRVRNCRQCGAEIVILDRNIFYCSLECRQEKHRIDQRDRKRRESFCPPRNCPVCQKEFPARGMKTYCDKLCATKARNDRQNAQYHTPEGKQKQRQASRKSIRRQRGVTNPTGDIKSGDCEICKKHFDTLVLDHCHTTGVFRGWLCSQCNTGIGHFEDDSERLLSAVEYLNTKTQNIAQGTHRLPDRACHSYVKKQGNYVTHIATHNSRTVCGMTSTEVRCYPQDYEGIPEDQEQCCMHCASRIKSKRPIPSCDESLPRGSLRWFLKNREGCTIAGPFNSRIRALKEARSILAKLEKDLVTE